MVSLLTHACVDTDTHSIAYCYNEHNAIMHPTPSSRYVLVQIPEGTQCVESLAVVQSEDGAVRLIIDEVKHQAFQEKVIDDKWQLLRLKRNRLLTETDWTQLSDGPLTPELQATYGRYRAALRDLPASVVDIDNVTFPKLNDYK